MVGSSGNNKIAALLDRGNMALEDGDWAKADSFFEDVLNNDSKNAQAYLGKTLAQERCRTIDAFARKRKDASQNVRGEMLELQPNSAHVDEMVERFSLPGYVEQGEICKLYDFNLSYHSDVAERKQQYKNEEKFWADHKQLSKAEKFAVGAVAENLAREKQALFAALADRRKKAETAEAAAKKDVQARYEAHLRQADEQAEKLYQGGCTCREKVYQELLKIAKTSDDVKKLTDAAKRFEALGSYQDSEKLAEHCRKRVAEDQKKLDTQREKEVKARAAKKKKLGITVMAVLVLAAAAFSAWQFYFLPNAQYNQAVELMEADNYLEAIAAFETLEGYSDSEGQIAACNIAILDEKYEAAVALMEAGDCQEAISAFEALEGHRDSEERISACNTVKYEAAVALMEAGDYREALAEFDALNGYKDSVEQARALRGQIAVRDTIIAEFDHTVGLRSDGTVVAVGSNRWAQCDVSDWTDIVAISAAYAHTVGLKADGTVVAVGYNGFGQCDVSDWENILVP